MKSSRIIGITGPSGSGKSALTAVLKNMGYPCVDADQIARQVVYPGSPCLSALSQRFGSGILNPDNSLNRKALAAIGFATKENTAALNRIMHPAILDAIAEKINAYRAFHPEWIFIDAPQLFESGLDRQCDATVAVLSDEQTRLNRIMRRDGITKQQAKLRMQAAYTDAFFQQHADLVLYNPSDDFDLQECAKALCGQLDGICAQKNADKTDVPFR